jgi:hypothetical protein
MHRTRQVLIISALGPWTCAFADTNAYYHSKNTCNSFCQCRTHAQPSGHTDIVKSAHEREDVYIKGENDLTLPRCRIAHVCRGCHIYLLRHRSHDPVCQYAHKSGMPPRVVSSLSRAFSRFESIFFTPSRPQFLRCAIFPSCADRSCFQMCGQRGLWRLRRLFGSELRRLRERLFDLLPPAVAHEMVCSYPTRPILAISVLAFSGCNYSNLYCIVFTNCSHGLAHISALVYFMPICQIRISAKPAPEVSRAAVLQLDICRFTVMSQVIHDLSEYFGNSCVLTS